MNKNTMVSLSAVIALVVCAAGWVMLPSLQGDSRSVEVDTGIQIERARRILDRYDAQQAIEALTGDQILEDGIEIDADFIAEDLSDDYQQYHDAAWTAYQPSDWASVGGSPRAAKANYGNIAGQVRQGVDGTADAAQDNERLLQDALSAVREALSVEHGDVSARDHAEANRLKAIILYHQGMATWIQARMARRESTQYRVELESLAGIAVSAQVGTQEDSNGEFAGKIAQLREKLTQDQTSLGADRQVLAELDAKRSTLENDLAAAKKRRDGAYDAISEIKIQGIDFSDPHGGANFATRLEQQAATFRSADNDARALEFGTYPSAQIDQSGDYLSGRYVEPGSDSDPIVLHGLRHYLREHAVLAGTIEGRQQAVEDLRSDIARLESIQTRISESKQRAATSAAKAASDVGEVYAELSRIDSEAHTIEDEALELFDEALRDADQAARSAGRWVSNASDRARSLSAEAQERSAFSARSRDGWMGGFIGAISADVRIARAWIYYERFNAYTRNGEVLSKMSGAAKLGEADPAAENEKAKEAHDAGVEEINRAMQALRTAHGKAERHWTITAQGAGVTYLMALFGHEDYVADSIEAYRAAVSGRENDSVARTFVRRLERLSDR